ncbi:ribonuclease Y [Candidatus Marinamargulisbacteria bacterium SCGC AG-410-N11]|nr:ribonuclease Y [Candidatus Marinamargulisbacteria bacterium SCGC AG-410-N11]
MKISIIISLSVSIVLILIFFLNRQKVFKKLESAKNQAKKTIESSKNEATEILTKAQTDSQKLMSKTRLELEKEIETRRSTINQIEKTIFDRQKEMDKKDILLNEKEAQLQNEIDAIKELKRKQNDIIKDLSSKLEKIAGFSKEEAEKQLMQNVEKEIREKAGSTIKNIEDQAKKIANRRAKEIVINAIQRTAVDHVASITTSVVQLPDDDMKGRVIGKEGRNIRAFESETGVDIIIDDSPGAVVISAFDPIRREIAKIALKNLLEDGRIHPSKIEESVINAKKTLNEKLIELGEKAADEVGMTFHPKIIELLGKLHYRSSYGQNILSHSLEAAHVAGIIASQLNVNVALAKRGTLLHDIGKALDFEQEGTHTQLGKNVCEKYGESPEILNCIMAHHEEEEPDTIEAIIVMIADAISSSRPGARRESLQNYIKRLEKLEGIAYCFEGVEKAYAIQAGRELRIFVRPEQINDNEAHKLAFDISQKVEKEVDYPGEVKVSIIREMRAFSVAK